MRGPRTVAPKNGNADTKIAVLTEQVRTVIEGMKSDREE